MKGGMPAMWIPPGGPGGVGMALVWGWPGGVGPVVFACCPAFVASPVEASVN